ncbi:hypothetical protein SNE40_009467 [Patella caerulea]|uniref:DUF4476 domain-containing protein n=1 Tax=Patella caerulea TaxID=87958 RepID=A0AAN8JNU5_PATCE
MFIRVLCVIACVASCLAVGPCAPNEDFLAILKAIHKSPSYKSLNAEQQVMLSELFAEAASCQLTAYIQVIGYAKILALIDHLSTSEAHFLSNYLQQHLAWEQSLGSIVTGPVKQNSTTTSTPTTT